MDGSDYGYKEVKVDGVGATYRKLEGSEHTQRNIEKVQAKILKLETDLEFKDERRGRSHCGGHGYKTDDEAREIIGLNQKLLRELRAKLAKQLKAEAKEEEEKRIAREARMEVFVWDGEVRDEDVEEVRERRGLEVSEDGRVRAKW